MDITIDKRKTDIIYVDKKNNHVCNNNEVLKLINNDNDTNLDIYIYIIAISNNLNHTEIVILKYLMTHNGSSTQAVMINDVSRIIKKSNTTVIRGIDNLRNKRLIYITETYYIYLSNNIFNEIDKLENAKFMVIELNPNITSKGITI